MWVEQDMMVAGWSGHVCSGLTEEIGKLIPNESVGWLGEPNSTQHNFPCGIILVSHQQIAERTDCAALLLSESDSKAKAVHGHRDAGLHGTVTNISQLSRATGQKSCKMGLHREVFHVAVKRINNHHHSASDSTQKLLWQPAERSRLNNGSYF